MILLDEPETSLHPRWQQVVVDVIASMIKESEGESPQLFVATHSERVLESLIGKGDTLIIRLYRDAGKVVVEPIDLMGLLLPKPTFAELDYVIFGMLSYDYHDQLFAFYSNLMGVSKVGKIDDRIKNTTQYQKEQIAKQWEKRGRHPEVYETLPVYIRNWFHHPGEGHQEPTQEELARSIQFLRAIIRDKQRHRV